MTDGLRFGARWRVAARRVRGWRRDLDFALAKRFGLATREDRLFFLLIPLVGLLSGVLGLLITQLIAIFQTFLWGSGEEILTRARNAPAWLRVVARLRPGTDQHPARLLDPGHRCGSARHRPL